MRFMMPYHPQPNGTVKRFHRRLMDLLRSKLADLDWANYLPCMLVGLRASLREYSGVSAADVVYGFPLSLPSQFLSAAELPPATFVQQLRSSLPCRAVTAARLLTKIRQNVRQNLTFKRSCRK
jgi:hypothetical protein